MQIDYLNQLPDEYRDSAIQLYMSALEDKLVPILGNDARAYELLGSNMDPTRCLAAIYNQKLVGILGINNNKIGFLNPTLKGVVSSYGLFGGIYRMVGLGLLDHPAAADEFYIDGFAVVDEMRGQGIGTNLFKMLEKTAENKGIRKITLDVIDINEKARALYERLGFAVTKQRKLWPFNRMFKFSFQSAIHMEKMIG